MTKPLCQLANWYCQLAN